jgi:predicted nucleic acid-binding protein
MTMSLQVLNECYSVLRRQLGEGPALRAERGFLAGLRTLATAPFDLDNLDIAWSVQDRYQTSWWDGLILSSAVRAGCTHMLTEDNLGADPIEGVRIVDPFAQTPEAFIAGLA